MVSVTPRNLVLPAPFLGLPLDSPVGTPGVWGRRVRTPSTWKKVLVKRRVSLRSTTKVISFTSVTKFSPVGKGLS